MQRSTNMNKSTLTQRLSRIILLAAVIFSCGFATAYSQAFPSRGEIWSQKMVESHGLKDFYTNKVLHEKLSNTGWDYVTGLIAISVLKAWEQYPDKTEYYNAVKAFADRNTKPDGSMVIDSKG